jgi:hypothetical protein
MPYDNPENRDIARETNYINKRFVEHTDALGTSQTINYRNPSVAGAGYSGGARAIGGGVGCAEFKGATASKDYEKSCGGTNLGRKSEDPVGVSLSGGAILGLQDNTILGAKTAKKERKPRNKILFGSLGNSIPADMGTMAPTIPAATAVRASAIKDFNSPIETLRKGRGRPRKVQDGTSFPMKAPRVKKGGNGFASGTHMDTGEGPATLGVKSRKTKKGGSTFNAEDPVVKAKRVRNGAKYAAAKKEGAGVVDTVVEFVKGLVKGKKKDDIGVGIDWDPRPKDRRVPGGRAAIRNKPGVVEEFLTKAYMGRGKKEAVTDESGNPLLPTTTKRTVRSTAKKEVKPMTEKAQLPSSTLSGLGKMKKHNPRAEIVKKVMAEQGLGMIAASSYVKEHGLY